MKTILTIIIMIFAGNLLAQTGTVEITITAINAKTGNIIRLAMYDKDNFLKETKEKTILKTEGNVAFIRLENIDNGAYAIAVFQDENLDGKMNTSFMGKPKELSGFSNNAKGNFGAPEFKDAAFNVIDKKTTQLTIHLEK